MTSFPAEWRSTVDSYLTEWLSEHRVPGAAFAVIDGDSVAHAEGYGARDLDSNAPATPDTRYGVASVTKSFTALAVLQQVDAGRLALDDPVTEFLDGYDALDPSPTVHDLLTHTSGMPSDGASVALIARNTGADPVEVPLSSEADLRRHVAAATDDRAADDRFRYYNTGYTLLGKLVEELDGRSFSTYVEEDLLDPFGMTDSVLAPDSLDGFEDAMTPYRREDGERVPCPFPSKGVGAAGGLVASVSDLASYLRYQVAGGADLLDHDLLAEGRRPHATRQTYLDGTTQEYGYGWMTRPFLDDTLVEHGGSLGVSTAYVGFLRDAGVGVALACNDSPDVHPQHVGPAVLALLHGEDPADVTRFHALREKAERVAGTYESHRGIQTASVDAAGGTLDVTFETALDEQSVTAFPESTDVDDLSYYAVGADGARIPVEFAADGEGLSLFYRRWRLRSAE